MSGSRTYEGELFAPYICIYKKKFSILNVQLRKHFLKLKLFRFTDGIRNTTKACIFYSDARFKAMHVAALGFWWS